MKSFVAFATLASLSALLLTGCDLGPEKPAKTIHHRKQPKAEAPPKPVKLPKLPPPPQPGTLDYLDANNGFRDAVFGQAESHFSNLVLQNRNDAEQTTTYSRVGDVLSMEGIPLESIEYRFFKDRLTRITLRWHIEEKNQDATNSTSPSAEIALVLAKIYGRPKHRTTKKDIAHYSWAGKQVEIMMHELRLPGVRVSNLKSWSIPPSTSGEMVIESIPLRHEFEAALAARAHERL